MNSVEKETQRLYKWLIASLIFTYALIFVGGLVRVSGSGMGCPDWPTCFGRLSPPTHIDQITWYPNTDYEVGDMIVHIDTLWVSDLNFTSLQSFGPENWHPYEKHNYAIFNARHTWTEYINRLFGATTGLVITITMLLAFLLRKSFPIIALCTMGIFILTGFEGWLGAKVVESHLSPMVITLHMLFALIIVSLQVFTLMRISNKNIELTESATSYAETIPFYLQCLWVITVIEILLGTHMREGLELLVLSFPQSSTDFLMSTLGTFKYVHTGLGIVLVSLTALLWNKIMVHSSPSSVIIVLMRFLIGLFIFQVGMGELMVFGEFSPSFRLLHMWGASISIAIIMAMFMRINMESKKSNV